jgi:hypothetical protein
MTKIRSAQKFVLALLAGLVLSGAASAGSLPGNTGVLSGPHPQGSLPGNTGVL